MSSTMSTQEIANQLVALCKEGKNKEAYQTLFAQDAVAVEPFGEQRETKGVEALVGKAEFFANSIEVHGMSVGEPIVTGSHFALTMGMDSTNKETQVRSQMEEICLYEVKDGKICREEFFYGM